ncbi:MAG: double zinc ribbon domain-containing protein [Lachnospiraceae bacterium]|nr:double zinc ribbon domain-containing protein [Lachnospiraceae bacterium]
MEENMKRTFLEILTDIFYPRRCPVCDKAVRPFGGLICETCKAKFIYVKQPYCLKCGKELTRETEEYCGDCLRRRHLFDNGRSLFVYKSVADSIYRFKYKGRQEYGTYYAGCMAKRLGGWIAQRRPDALIPVPIHAAKRRVRGYNQAHVLARELGRCTGIPVEADLVKRIRRTAPMKDLPLAERQNNLKRAFKICRNDVKLDTVIIIDDIYTTGSTIDSMSYELRRAGVKHIYFVTLAIGNGI